MLILRNTIAIFLVALSGEVLAVRCKTLTLSTDKAAVQIGETFKLKIFTGAFPGFIRGNAGLFKAPLDFTISVNDEFVSYETTTTDPYTDWHEVIAPIRGFTTAGKKELLVGMKRPKIDRNNWPNCELGTIPITATTIIDVMPSAAITLSKTGFTGLWWNAKTSGQGIFFSQNAPLNIAFVGWFTYDQNGKAKWYVGDRCIMGNGTMCSTKLYETKGAIFNGTDFSNANLRLNEVGEASFSFATAQEATMRYPLKGVVGKIDLVRQPF